MNKAACIIDNFKTWALDGLDEILLSGNSNNQQLFILYTTINQVKWKAITQLSQIPCLLATIFRHYAKAIYFTPISFHVARDVFTNIF